MTWTEETEQWRASYQRLLTKKAEQKEVRQRKLDYQKQWRTSNPDYHRTKLRTWRADHPYAVLASKLRAISSQPELSIFEAFVAWDALPEYKQQIGHNLNPRVMLELKEQALAA